MKKSVYVSLVALLFVLSLGLTVIPRVSSAPEDIKISSYGWYIDSLGFLVVVGEVQNVGQSTIDSVILTGQVYTVDGQPRADSYTQVYARYLVPQQKAPFYMEFNPGSSSTGDLSWLSIGLERVDFTVVQSETTTNYNYPDLKIKQHSGAEDAEGVYWVDGTVENNGTQTATKIMIFGTFYNATGDAIGMGYTDPISSLAPSGVSSFRLGAFDLNQTEVPSDLKISSYSLLIQVEAPILSGTPPPPNNTTSSGNSTDNPDSNQDNSADAPPWSTYAIVATAAIFAIVGSILLLRNRKSKRNIKRKSQMQKKHSSKKR